MPTLTEIDLIDWLCEKDGLVLETAFYSGNTGVVITRQVRSDLRACYYVHLGDSPRIHTPITADEVGAVGVTREFHRRVSRCLGM
jgi:hypothetical protein